MPRRDAFRKTGRRTPTSFDVRRYSNGPAARSPEMIKAAQNQSEVVNGRGVFVDENGLAVLAPELDLHGVSSGCRISRPRKCMREGKGAVVSRELLITTGGHLHSIERGPYMQ